jgi:hypothetical protein
MRGLLSVMIYQSINQSIYLSIYLSVCLPICPSIHLSTYLSIYLSINQWLYSPLLDLGRFSVSLSFTQSVGLLRRGISQSQGRYLHAQGSTNVE